MKTKTSILVSLLLLSVPEAAFAQETGRSALPELDQRLLNATYYVARIKPDLKEDGKAAMAVQEVDHKILRSTAGLASTGVGALVIAGGIAGPISASYGDGEAASGASAAGVVAVIAGAVSMAAGQVILEGGDQRRYVLNDTAIDNFVNSISRDFSIMLDLSEEQKAQIRSSIKRKLAEELKDPSKKEPLTVYDLLARATDGGRPVLGKEQQEKLAFVKEAVNAVKNNPQEKAPAMSREEKIATLRKYNEFLRKNDEYHLFMPRHLQEENSAFLKNLDLSDSVATPQPEGLENDAGGVKVD